MRIQIHADNAAVKSRVEQLSRFYLTCLHGQLESIELGIDDILDPLGQALKRCRVSARLGQGDTLQFIEIQADLALAVSRALERASRTIRRRSALRRLVPTG